MEPSDLTRDLRRATSGDRAAAERVYPVVYPRLVEVAKHLLRGQDGDHTLLPEALVHESFLKLIGASSPVVPRDRKHYFCLCALAMRQVLVDYARARQRSKRPPADKRLPASVLEGFYQQHRQVDLVALDEALDQLSNADPVSVELVQLRFFVGLGASEAARALELSKGQARKHWEFAQAFLRTRLEENPVSLA